MRRARSLSLSSFLGKSIFTFVTPATHTGFAHRTEPHGNPRKRRRDMYSSTGTRVRVLVLIHKVNKQDGKSALVKMLPELVIMPVS